MQIKQMRMKQNSTTFLVRNNSMSKKPGMRINSLQKQFHSSMQQRKDTFECQVQQQSSAIMELLQIKDEQIQWKEKNVQNKNKSSKQRLKKDIEMNRNLSKVLVDKKLKQKQIENEVAELWRKTQLQNIFVKKASHQENKTQKNYKRTEQQILCQQNQILLKDHKNSTFFMNHTNYWKRQQKTQKSHDLSLTQKLHKKFSQNIKHMRNQQKFEDRLRVNSNLEFYRRRSPLIQNHDQQNIADPKSLGSTGASLIKISSNKAVTVRQMLDKIRSHEDIALISSETQPQSECEVQFQRLPFDPYIKRTPRLHHKKFTPFKLQQQKRMEYSLQKLSQKMKNNPQIDEKWQDMKIRYLEKPIYCSWVERNKDKIKRKKQIPLTVRPLKLVN